jgi:hypothetical protein
MASSAIASTSAPLASSARWTDRRRRRPRDESLRRTPRSIARASASASEPPPPPAAGAAGAKQRVVITGSTKGLGLALARAFLSRGDGVFITSRDAENVRATVADLRSRFGDAAVVHGHPSNVGDASSVAALADEVVKVFGGVDLWINNAGSNGYRYENLDDADPATIAEVVTTNSLGSILCTRQAIITMKRHNDVVMDTTRPLPRAHGDARERPRARRVLRRRGPGPGPGQRGARRDGKNYCIVPTTERTPPGLSLTRLQPSPSDP